MRVDYDSSSEDIRVLLDVHDTHTNRNWTAEVYGTTAEIKRLLQKSARLMEEAGFEPGWHATATPAGSIEYIVMVREAVERCWRMNF